MGGNWLRWLPAMALGALLAGGAFVAWRVGASRNASAHLSLGETTRALGETTQQPAGHGPAYLINGRHFVGVAQCVECHAERVETYQQTSHYNAMQRPRADHPLGHYPGGFQTHEKNIWYEASRDEHGYYVTSYGDQSGDGQEHKRTEQIFMVMGSGKLSHSPFYRHGDEMFQMPLFFFSPLNEWLAVPGFLDLMPYWGRAIKPRCLDCHATYFEHIEGTKNSYRYDNAILEISCERCHGRGSEHVAYHRAHPEAYEPVAITHPQTLSRQRQLEVCGQCHGEIGKLLKPAFTYSPGDPLDEYVERSDDQDDAFVRSANQLQRLELSKCFQKSEMTCTTCHNPHELEREQLPVFSQRCQECHEADTHPEAEQIGPRLTENCIDCHMPKADDENLPFKLETGERVKLIQMRDHVIGIYPEDSAALRKQWADPDAPLEANNLRPAVAKRRVAYAWVRQGDKEFAAGRVEQGLAALDRALTYDPHNLPALLATTRALSAHGRLNGSIERARQAVALDPSSIEALALLAFGLLRAEQYAESQQRYRELLQLAPDHREALNNLAWMLATHVDGELRNGGEAVELAARLCTASPHPPWSHLDTLAAACAEAQQWDRAIEAATLALAECEADAQAGRAKVAAVQARLERYRRHEAYRDEATFGKKAD